MSVAELALELPVAERLQLMEALWQSLRQEVEASDPPEWHLEALRETQAQYDAGELIPIDWETAKKMLLSER